MRPAPEHAAPACIGRRAWLGWSALALWAVPPPARALGQPSGPVVLTVRGHVNRTNDGQVAQFDLPMLQALPQTSFVTRTPWFAQARRFTGPLLRDVLALAGAQGSLLRMIALNDYRVELPFDDAQRHDVLVACLLDDKPMTVREKGPLFVVYPFDLKPELRSAIYYSRSAWQLRTIEVL